MKKLLLLFIVTLLFNTAKSQAVFCPPGAQWNYIFYNGLGNGYFRMSINYAGDSLLTTGETVKKLTHNTFFKYFWSSNFSASLVKQRGDTVFVKNQFTAGSWQILYNYAATSGQQWITTFSVPPSGNSGSVLSHTTQVLSVSTITVNNVS